MSQQTRRLTAQAGLVDDMPSVYATADPQMFNEIFNFQTGVELLGIPAAAKDNNNNNNNSNPNWRVSHGHHHQQYENMAASGGGGGGAVQFNSLKETNMNSMQGIHNMDAMQLISGHAHSAIAFPSNVIDHPEFNSHKNYAEISCQFPGFSMGNQSLCSGGINELLLLPSGNGNLQNNTQFAPQQQQHHLSSTVNWDNRQMGSVHPSTSQWTEQALETKIGDDRSVQGLSLSLSSNSQVQVQSFETTRLISSQDYKSKSGHDVFNGSKVGFFTPFSRSEGSKGLWNPNNQMNSGSSGLFAGYMKQSKYMKPTKQLLDEFCNVAAKGVKNVNSSSVPKQEQQKSSFGGHNTIGSIAQTERKLGGSSVTISSTPTAAAAATGICNESGNGKDQINFSGDRFELRRRKAKLLWMLDEVDRRYRHYCEQMKVVVTSFESAAGAGAASTYTCLASKAMSRHFRCLKDAIGSQIKATNDALGEKESSVPGITKGETPRLKLIEQSLRQQRAFQQVGMLEQDAWRPQRGLPERAVTVLRAWLFEHFLHPYPSDADKHLLARQTGLSRSQVSNWFINARVRLWKPMVEEMYQEEAREAEMKEKDTIPDPNTHEKHEGASDSNKSSEEFKQMTAPDSSGCMSLPMESQDEMFDCSFRGGGGEQLMSFSRNANNTSARKSEASELIGEHSDIKVHGSEVGNIDFSCYNGNGSNNSNNGIFHQPTYFGNGDVSLTLGLRHTGALSVPVADQEKYHSALYLP